jgi:pilus assembly protein Flp/PilA
MKNLLKRLWHDEEGQDLIEYALLAAIIALAAIVTMGTLAQDINNVFSSIGSDLSSSTT